MRRQVIEMGENIQPNNLLAFDRLLRVKCIRAELYIYLL